MDFRAAYAPKRREMLRRAAADTVTGVLGISRWGNWPFFAASWTWNFVRTRHGAASDRVARLQSYAQVRQWLALDPSLDEVLRTELQRRLEILGMNPLEVSVFQKAEISRRQYAALIKYSDDPQGLAARLRRDRNAEATRYEHGWVARAGLVTGKVVTLGMYSHQEHQGSALLPELDRERRLDRSVRFLEAVASSTPQTEVVWNMDEVRRALDQISAAGFEKRSAQVIQRILLQTHDEATRALCVQALGSLNAEAGQ